MALQEQSVAEQLIDARERYVARGAGNPKLVVGGAHGAIIESIDGREYLDFVGGIGCQNLGHGPEKVVAAVHAQVDRFLHQMSMVVSYEGYVDVCRLLAETSPCAGAVEEHAHQQRRRGGRERRQDLARRHRPAGRAGLRPRLPRAHAARDDDDLEARLQEDVRAVRARDLPRRRRPTSTAASRATTPSRRSSSPSRPRSTPSRWPAPCWSPCRARAASSRCRSTSRRASRSCSTATASSTSTTRSSPAAAAPGRCGRSSTTACSPTSSPPARRSAAACRWRPSPGRAEVMDAPHIGGLGGTFAGNPVSCAAATVVLEELARPEVLSAATRLGERLRAGARRRPEPDRRGRRRARPRADARDRARDRPQDEGAGGRPRHAHDRRGARPRPAADGLGHLLERASASCRRSTSRTRSSSAGSRSSRSRWSRPGRHAMTRRSGWPASRRRRSSWTRTRPSRRPSR